MDLSIIIPARNEEFLSKTIENIFENIEGDTEVIAVLDGSWANPPINDNPRLRLIHHSKSIGQRASMNEAVSISKAKYIMKVDAHCSFDRGFDVKMMKDMKDDWTMVPIMYNLHAFDWVCNDCDWRDYQGPTPEKCPKCGGSVRKDIIWKKRHSPASTAFRFDNTLHFQYWSGYKKRQKGQLVETMSLQGSCFMCTRDKYLELGMADERHGSWGQQGVEVALKTWLSGGKVIVNKNTWYAHMFRTQGKDFGFPYPNDSIQQARKHSRWLWLEGNWEKAKHDIQWLIDRFAPVPDWDLTKGILYYTDNELAPRIMSACQKQLKKSVQGKKIVSVALKDLEFGDIRVKMDLKRGYLTMAKQILKGLETLDTDIVFFCEHDVLYHKSHFDFTPPKEDTFYYNENVWFCRLDDMHFLHYKAKQLSGLCAYRKPLIEHFKERVALIEKEGFSRKMGFEPMTHRRIKWNKQYKADGWKSEFPNVDLKHDKNLSKQRWKKSEFRNQRFTEEWEEAKSVKGWNDIKEMI